MGRVSYFRSMIKAHEVRIGNIVMWNGKPTKLSALHIYTMFDAQDEAEEGSPIQITPEILKKAGFVSTGSGDDFHNGILWNTPNENYKYCEDGYIVDNCGYYGHYCDIGDVSYLHQLQNLYFALTGEELTIALPAVK